MAEASNLGVDKHLFQAKITELKEEKSQNSNVDFYLDNSFYEKAKTFLKQKKKQTVGVEVQNPVQLNT